MPKLANSQLPTNLISKTDLPSNQSTKNHKMKNLPNLPLNDSIIKTQNNPIKHQKSLTIKLPPFHNLTFNLYLKSIKIKPTPKKDNKAIKAIKELKEINQIKSNKKVKYKMRLKNLSLKIVGKGKKYIISSSKVEFFHL